MASPMHDRKLDHTTHTNMADKPSALSANANNPRDDISTTRSGWTVHRSLRLRIDM